MSALRRQRVTFISKLDISALRHPGVFLATGFGVGLLPFAPGTWGSLIGLAIWWFGFSLLDPLVAALGIGLSVVLATALLTHVCRRFELGDESALVLDEIAGQWVALLFLPRELWVLVAGFVLFRLLDIAKPWPISKIDREIKGGVGVMLDDLLAGVLVCAALHVTTVLLL